MVKTGHRHKTLLSAVALLLTLLVGVTYVLLGALRWNPLTSVYRFTVELPASGGLMTNQDVTLRGVRVGKVEALTLTPAGVNAQVRMDSSVKLSETSKARVAGLSAAGEQYIDFDERERRSAVHGQWRNFRARPYRSPGDARGTARALRWHAQAGRHRQAGAPSKELSISKDGPQKLSDIVEGGTFLLSALDGVLPQTASLLKTSRVTLQLLADKNAGMKVATANLSEVFGGVNRMTGGFRTLTQEAPKALAATDNLFADNSETMVQLLGDLATTSNSCTCGYRL